MNWIKQIPHRLLQVLDAIAFAFGYYVRIWRDILFHWIPDLIRDIVHELQALPGQVAAIFTAVWNAATSWVVKMWHDVTGFVSQMFNDVVGFFTRLPGETAKAASGMWNAVTSWVARMWHDTTNFVSNLFNDVVNFFTRLPGEILGFAHQMWDSANRVASGVWHGLMDTLNQLPDLVVKVFENVLHSIEHMAGKIADGAKHVASSMWNAFKDGLGIHSPSYIENALTAIGDEGDNTVDRMHKSVGTLATLAHKATSVTMNAKQNLGSAGSTMAFANLTLNGDINFQNQSDINYFFQKLGRNVELTQQGLTAIR